MSGSACRSCGASIVWARTDSGRLMPVDREPSAQGRLVLRTEDGELHVRVAEENARGVRHRPHFATCPDADSWRAQR